LKDNDTWSLAPLLEDKHCIGCKYVFKLKYNANGLFDKYKTRLVIKDYIQQARIIF